MMPWCSGIDLGTTHLRAVVLKRQGKRWSWHRAVSIPRLDERGHRRDLPELFRLLRKNIRLRGPVRLLDSTMNVLVRFVSHPPVSDDRLQRGMRMELVQHADTEGNLAADFMPLPIDSDDLTVCCCLAQPADVDRLMETSDRYRMNIAQLGPAMAGIADCYAEIVAPELDGDFIEQPPPEPISFDDDDEDESEVDQEDPVDEAEPERDVYTLLLDIGAVGSRVVLMRNRDFMACRSLPVGGRRFSEDLAEARGIKVEEAERIKVTGAASPPIGELIGALADRQRAREADNDGDDGLFDEGEQPEADASDEALPGANLFSDPDEGAVADDGDSAGSNAETLIDDEAERGDSVPPTLRGMAPVDVQPGGETITIGNRQLGPELRRVADNLFMQVSSSINWFRAQLQQPRLNVDRIYCSGGGSRLAGLNDYLGRRFRCPVANIDRQALAGLQGDGPDHPELFVNAVGAAVPFGRQAMQFDLRSQDRQARDLMRSLVLRPYIAALLVIAAGIIAAVAFHLRHDSSRAALEVYDRHERRYENLAQELGQLQATSVDLQEDLRGIAGRIFSGRDLLNAIRVFKERAPEDLWITDLRTEGLTSDGEEAEDTAIDRGSIYIEGHCKPTGARTDRVKIFENWCDGIAAWSPPGSDTRLFTSHKMDFDTGALDSRTDGKKALETSLKSQEFTFWARFDFMPTQLAEVAVSASDETEGE